MTKEGDILNRTKAEKSLRRDCNRIGRELEERYRALQISPKSNAGSDKKLETDLADLKRCHIVKFQFEQIYYYVLSLTDFAFKGKAYLEEIVQGLESIQKENEVYDLERQWNLDKYVKFLQSLCLKGDM